MSKDNSTRKSLLPAQNAEKVSLRLDWATAKSARFACEQWHYSKNLPTTKTVRIGVWESGAFKGVVVFGYGATPNLLKPYGLKMTDGCELIRVALRQHKAPVSQIVSISIRLLRKKCPNLKLIVSFADPNHGHHGGIYQGMNWLYSGRTSPDRFYKDKAGNIFHPRQVSESKKTKRQFGRRVNKLDAKNLQRIIMPGKHRYLLALNNEMQSKIAHLRKPYPKRAGSIVNDATPDQGV
jgi:hypothetical protein